MSPDRHAMIYDKIVRTIADVVGVEISELHDQTELILDLNLDSLAMYEIVVELEETYDLQISDAEIDRIHTIADVVRHIELALS